MTDQPPNSTEDPAPWDLFNQPAETVTAEDDLADLTPAERFERFHQLNPAVYTELVAQARAWRRARPNTRLGMDFLFARLRWVLAMQTEGEPWRINDHHLPYYARLIMRDEPDLDGLFETRRSPADAWIADLPKVA